MNELAVLLGIALVMIGCVGYLGTVLLKNVRRR